MTSATIFCHEGNADEFRAALRAEPEAYAFAAALYKAGLIDGLRGATLRPGGTAPEREASRGVTPVLSDAAETRLADMWWQRMQAQQPEDAA